MQIQPLSADNVREVFADLSVVHQHEAHAFGVSVEGVEDKFLSLIGEPFTGALHDPQGRCFGLIALEPLGGNRWRTRFALSQEAMVRGGLGITRFFAEFSDRIVADTGGSIEILSAFPSDLARSWFARMGFRPAESQGRFEMFVKGGA